MSRRGWIALAACVAVIGLGAALHPAEARGSFDYLFDMHSVSNDHEMFLNLTVSNAGLSRPEIEPMLPRLPSVEADLPVVLFLAHQSGRPVEGIVDLRSRGMSWSMICRRVSVPPAVLFAGIDRDPGPPYGAAWGSWRRRPRAVVLSDADSAGLVQIQVGHRVVGTSPYELARGCGQGRPVPIYVAEHRGRPYGDEHGHGKHKEKWKEEHGKHKHGHHGD